MFELLSFNVVGKMAFVRAKVKHGDKLNFPRPSEIDNPKVQAQDSEGNHVAAKEVTKTSAVIKTGKDSPEKEIILSYRLKK